ncbi:hypothetical protein M0R45_015178 [Rubus argutus]|uniref:Aminotransferase-like plant mobile domain-containing protein n=1 Tax=Rubus argutus TaxID=59490 RepID=A0AAW1XNS2_RUBAR
MQFGFDQDIPCFIAPLNCNSNITWKQYLKELENARLYIPCRLSEADTSTRYFKWWKESVAGIEHKSMPPKKKARKVVDEINDATIPCICSPKNPKELVQISAGRKVYEEALRLGRSTILLKLEKSSESEKLSVQDQISASLIADESSVNTTKSERLEKEVALIALHLRKRVSELKSRVNRLEKVVEVF